MFSESDLTLIPNFIKAKTLQGLRLACLKNNMRLGGFVNYFGIQQVTEGSSIYWIAFFYERIDKNLSDKLVTDGKAK